MTPLEALNLIYQAAGMARLTRMEHAQVDQAALALKEIVEARTDAKADEPPAGPRAVN